MKTLLVEDDTELGKAIQHALQCSGYLVEWITRGDDALYLLTMTQYDLAILNLGLPGLDGLEVLKNARRRQIAIPIILITARNSLKDRITGLDLGADDYLTKPFDIPELEARLRALTRRYYNSNKKFITIDRLQFDLNRRIVYVANQPVSLPSRELTILETLLLRIGQVVSKGQLLESLYGFEYGSLGNTIEVYVHRLRKKLAQSGVKIHTVTGQGYMIDKTE